MITNWFKLPRNLRNLIWQTFVPGQEVEKTPSPGYLAAADQVQAWISENAT